MRKHWVRKDRLVEQEVPIRLSRSLTVEPKKFALFTLESTFRQGWCDLLEVSDADWLKSHTYVLLKPDCLAARKTAAVFNFLEAQGFEPLGLWPFQNTRNAVSEMWRYQWNSVPVDRSLTSTRLNCISRSAVLALRDVSGSSIPASVRLTALKGNAQRFLRMPNTLRWVLDCSNPMLAYIHTPDEPIDVLRELSILFPSEERREIFKGGSNLSWKSLTYQADQLCRETPVHDMNFEYSLNRLADKSPVPDELRAYIRDCYENLGMSWRRLWQLAGTPSESETGWDHLVVAAYCIFQNYDIPGIVENPGAEKWLAIGEVPDNE